PPRPNLHPFPTRRSSDLASRLGDGGAEREQVGEDGHRQEGGLEGVERHLGLPRGGARIPWGVLGPEKNESPRPPTRERRERQGRSEEHTTELQSPTNR